MSLERAMVNRVQSLVLKSPQPDDDQYTQIRMLFDWFLSLLILARSNLGPESRCQAAAAIVDEMEAAFARFLKGSPDHLG